MFRSKLQGCVVVYYEYNYYAYTANAALFSEGGDCLCSRSRRVFATLHIFASFSQCCTLIP